MPTDYSAFWLIALIPFIAIYFLPTIVAFTRHHQNRLAICLINIFLGYTFVGWLVAMIWSFTHVENSGERERPTTERIEPR